MKYSFLAALYNIKVSENLGNGDKIGDHFKITNNKSPLDKIITHQFQKSAGDLETNALKDCGAYIYSTQEISDDINPNNYLISRMYCVQEFLMATWLIKPSNVNFEVCFLISSDAQKSGVTSNFISHSYCGTSGEIQETTFTRDELRAARSLHTEKFGIKSDQKPISDNNFSDKSSRIGRSLTWINAARGNFDNSIRIANFCTAFETLFSTSHTEISHQLSERIAFFLSDNKKERLEIYQAIKKSYEIRSRIVHGSTAPSKERISPSRLAAQCEDIIKRIILKIISNQEIYEFFEQDNKELNAYFMERIF